MYKDDEECTFGTVGGYIVKVVLNEDASNFENDKAMLSENFI